jgi:hypothetical protein
MTVIDQILNEWSFRCHDGIVDINDPTKVSILNEILNEFNVELDERGRPKKFKEEPKSFEGGSFEEYALSKGFREKVLEQVLKIPKPTQDKILDFILTGSSNDINEVLNFVNNLPDKEIISKIKFSSTTSANEGEGETLLILCSKSGKKIAGKFGDVSIDGKSYEVKKGIEIRAGGTYKEFINRYLYELNYLKYEIFESEYSDAFKKVLGPNIVNLWNRLIKKGESGVNFTNIGMKKFNVLNELLIAIKDKLSQADFEQNDLQNISDKAVLTLKDLIKRPLFGANVGEEVKKEFISDVDGLISIDPNYNFKLYDKDQFVKDWDFKSIVGGNRPIFILKGQEGSTDEDYEE